MTPVFCWKNCRNSLVPKRLTLFCQCEPEREAAKKKKEQQQFIKWDCRKQTTYNRKCHTFC